MKGLKPRKIVINPDVKIGDRIKCLEHSHLIHQDESDFAEDNTGTVVYSDARYISVTFDKIPGQGWSNITLNKKYDQYIKL